MEILLVKIGQILIQMHFKWCNDTLTQCSIYIWEPVPLRSAQASVRAKVNNSSQIGLGYQQRLMKVVFLSNTWAIWQNQKSWNENNVFFLQGLTLTLSALIDGKNFNQGGHKVIKQSSRLHALCHLFKKEGHPPWLYVLLMLRSVSAWSSTHKWDPL